MVANGKLVVTQSTADYWPLRYAPQHCIASGQYGGIALHRLHHALAPQLSYISAIQCAATLQQTYAITDFAVRQRARRPLTARALRIFFSETSSLAIVMPPLTHVVLYVHVIADDRLVERLSVVIEMMKSASKKCASDQRSTLLADRHAHARDNQHTVPYAMQSEQENNVQNYYFRSPATRLSPSPVFFSSPPRRILRLPPFRRFVVEFVCVLLRSA
ncbi:uncharacterized protein MYCFIDRAFT_176326 [Pseudocercospora fijiensis CIRAD86]|uniref:Uncharacterized protein n=1 Tax=Pseudocercospora fijiensis (strain CIRAD86) TaxID=383855 RepID=M2YTA1_PSEFD|nr:uncharacterized protein MYCFIDRAFT_176326 [Pseudocercospora fijiensis CIRAD86]EME80980.1 hypothetical protein MYCFIDRAFT_176326 [Pseudocercospora fijiensis CIRAD86]